MFHDETTIDIRSGNGGPGCVSFRREKFIPEGGPNGGDGGRGGDVVFVASDHQNTLTAFVRRRKWHARNGDPGGNSNCTGKSAEPLILEVPCGTIIRDAETDDILADLKEHGQRFVIAKGGEGGLGNTNFKSSTNQVPRKATPGREGVRMKLKLELKLIADVGIMGFPNAGKSTLLSHLTNAKPKIANYPFTTLQAHLGVVERDERDLVLADIPGLIEGAAEGVGLGHRFLRHVERCPILLHLVDGSEGDAQELAGRIATLDAELARFSPALAERPQLIALNKADARPELPDTGRELAESLGREVLVVSAVSGYGMKELLARLLHAVSGDSDD